LFLRRAQHDAFLACLIRLEQSGVTHRMREGLEVATHGERIETVRPGERPDNHILGVAVPQRAPYLCGGMVELKQPARTPVVDDDPIEERRCADPARILHDGLVRLE
jgi:hypothetical protein